MLDLGTVVMGAMPVHLLFVLVGVVYAQSCIDVDLPGATRVDICSSNYLMGDNILVEFRSAELHILPCLCNITTQKAKMEKVSFTFLRSPFNTTCNTKVTVDNPQNTFECDVSAGTSVDIQNVNHVTPTRLILSQQSVGLAPIPYYCIKISAFSNTWLTINCFGTHLNSSGQNHTLKTDNKTEGSNVTTEYPVPPMPSEGNSEPYVVALFAVTGIFLLAVLHILTIIYFIRKRLPTKTSEKQHVFINPKEDGKLYFIIPKEKPRTERRSSEVYSHIHEYEEPIDKSQLYLTVIG